jgi:hypothetical protein
LSYAFTETLSLSFAAGPALVSADQTDPIGADDTSLLVRRYPLLQNDDGTFFIDADTCPKAKINGAKVRFLGSGCQAFAGAPPLTEGQIFALEFQTQGNTLLVPVEGTFESLDDAQPTYFADVTLTKEWERWSGELAYRRSEDRNSSLGAISDTVFGRLRWQVTSNLSSSWLASYERREQASEIQTNVQVVANASTPLPAFDQGARSQSVQRVTLDNDLSVDVITASWQLSYRFGDRAELYSIAAYRDESPRSVASTVLLDTNRFSFTVGLRYTFAPIPF